MLYKISVIIPVYCTTKRYGWQRLYMSLLGFSFQTLSVDEYEVIIVNDGSEMDINSLIQSWNFKFNIKIIDKSHTGMCSSYQAGISHSTGEYIFLGIDDNVPTATLLEDHILLHSLHCNTVVWGREYHMRQMKKIIDPILNNSARKKQVTNTKSLLSISEDDIANDFGKLIGNSEIIEKYEDIEKMLEQQSELSSLKAPWLIMRVGNQSLHKELLILAGGIDVNFDPSGWYADLELGLRLFKAKAKFILSKEAVMIHVSHDHTEEALKDEKTKHHYFYNKHPTLEVALLPLFFKAKITLREYSDYIIYLSQLINI